MNIIIYKENEAYYMLQDGKYHEQVVEIKPYTIAIKPKVDGIVKDELVDAVEYTYLELKKELLNMN